MSSNESPFQFKNPTLKNINFKVNNAFKPKEDGVTIQIETKTNVAHMSPTSANVTLSINIGKGNSPFTMYAEMTSDFKWDETIESDTVTEFLRTNAPALLVGYIRPIVAMLTSMSPFQVYHLPFLDMTDNTVREEDE